MRDVFARLVAFDIDGTLLDLENPISDVTAASLRELRKRGLQIVFVSSRPIASLVLLAQRLGIDAHLIAYNGALARNMSGQELLSESFVIDGPLIDILRRFCSSGGAVNVYVGGALQWLAFGQSTFVDIEELATGLTADSRLSSDALPKVAGTSVLKVMCRGVELACKQLLVDMESYSNLDAVASGWDCCDIQAKGVGKGHAVKVLCRNLGIAPDDVVAFGDSDSDASMLRLAGYGVAVGAATERAKMAAREHIDGPGSNALADWLDRIATAD